MPVCVNGHTAGMKITGEGGIQREPSPQIWYSCSTNLIESIGKLRHLVFKSHFILWLRHPDIDSLFLRCVFQCPHSTTLVRGKNGARVHGEIRPRRHMSHRGIQLRHPMHLHSATRLIASHLLASMGPYHGIHTVCMDHSSGVYVISDRTFFHKIFLGPRVLLKFRLLL